VSGAIQAADDHLIAAVATGQSGDPFAVLGRHEVTVNQRPAVVVRTMQPRASAVELITPGLVTPMPRRHPDGLFEARIPLTGAASELAYRFRLHEDGTAREIVDPYQYGQLLSDYDLHLFSEGTNHRAWAKLGSHVRTVGDITGVHFGVWAPNAQRVSVVGDFNRWDGRVHPMRKLVPSGVWELFIPRYRRAPATSSKSAPMAVTCWRRPIPTRVISKCRRARRR
jgi:1,4-alpha-glucan branching enzyme